jgi:hypothetical protein
MTRPERAADLGIKIGRFAHGSRNAISDVAGVRVAAETIVKEVGHSCAAEARCALALLQSCRRHWNQWGIRSSPARIG